VGNTPHSDPTVLTRRICLPLRVKHVTSQVAEAIYVVAGVEDRGKHHCRFGEQEILVYSMNALIVPCSPANAVGCEPQLLAATATIFYLQNKQKQRNFIMADFIARTGYFHFYVENIPKDGTGCPGSWLFEVAWDYFFQNRNVTIVGIRGDWISGDNLDTVNRLTTGNKMTLEEASKQTWTYQLAKSKGFSRYQYLSAKGSPGQYISVDVVFLP